MICKCRLDSAGPLQASGNDGRKEKGFRILKKLFRERVGVVVVVVANFICCDVDPKVVFELLAVFTGCSPQAKCYNML